MSRGVMTSSPAVPVFGPCVAMLPGEQFSLIFPVRKSTVERFDLDTIETAARVSLYDNVPKGRVVDDSVPVDIKWGEQIVEGPMGCSMYLVHLLAKTKEA